MDVAISPPPSCRGGEAGFKISMRRKPKGTERKGKERKGGVCCNLHESEGWRRGWGWSDGGVDVEG